MWLCSPVTNRQSSCFHFHSQCRLFQGTKASLERTADRSMMNHPLETHDVLHRVARIRQ
jgi:hypothetical protein